MIRLVLALGTAVFLAAPGGTIRADDAVRDDGTLKYRFYTEWELLYLERDRTPDIEVGFADPTAPPAGGLDFVQVLSTGDVMENDRDFAGRAVFGLRLDPASSVELVLMGFDHGQEQREQSATANLQAFVGGAGSVIQANNASFENAVLFDLDYDSDFFSGAINFRRGLDVPGADYRFNLLAGVRALRQTEDLRFTSFSAASGVGTHDISARNTLYGAQFGVEGFIPLYEDRVVFDLMGVAGGYANQASSTVDFRNQLPAFRSRASRKEWDAAAVMEASGFFRFRIYRGVRLSAGYRALYLVNVATAPDQFARTASNGDFFGNRFDNDDRALYHGPSVKVSVDF